MDAPISAVVTTLSIIEAMAERGSPVGVSELARMIGENKPRTYRHLRTLVERHYVTQDPQSEKYALTLKLFHLGQSIAAHTTFVNVAREIMVRQDRLHGNDRPGRGGRGPHSGHSPASICDRDRDAAGFAIRVSLLGAGQSRAGVRSGAPSKSGFDGKPAASYRAHVYRSRRIAIDNRPRARRK